MDYNAIISLVLTAGLGSGIGSLITLKATRKKAEAEVKTTELDNVQEAVKIWREMAEELRTELSQSRNDYKLVTEQVELLRKEVTRLTTVNNKIVKLLDQITLENLDSIVHKIKKEIHENNPA